MMNPRSLLLPVLPLLVACSLLFVTEFTWAHSEPAPPAEYTAAVTRAVELSGEQKWAEARKEFEKAHALYPNARTLRGMGIVAYQMNDYRGAYRHLLAALLEKRRALTDAQDAEVRNLLKKTEKLLARYTTRHLPEDASYTINGRPEELESNGTLLLPLGRHVVQVESNGSVSEAQVAVNGGEVGPLPVELSAALAEEEPIAAEPAPAPEPEPPPEPEPGPDPGPAAQKSPLPVILMMAGGLMVVSGAALFITGQNDVSKVENASVGTEWSTLENKERRAPLFTGLGAGLVGAGAALGVTGVIMHVSADSSETGLSVGVRGTW